MVGRTSFLQRKAPIASQLHNFLFCQSVSFNRFLAYGSTYSLMSSTTTFIFLASFFVWRVKARYLMSFFFLNSSHKPTPGQAFGSHGTYNSRHLLLHFMSCSSFLCTTESPIFYRCGSKLLAFLCAFVPNLLHHI